MVSIQNPYYMRNRKVILPLCQQYELATPTRSSINLMMIGILPAEPFNSVTNHKITFELNLVMYLLPL